MTREPLQVEYRSLDALIPFARNSRTHDEAQIAGIAGSIREFGWSNPILIDEDGGIIAGHGRALAARKLGMAEVPTITLAGLSKTQRRALVIADNKLALNAGWDLDLLKLELTELQEDGFDVGLTGFNADEISGLLVQETEGLTDPDETPEPPADPVSVPGDVWILGRHRIVCGDSTDPLVVEKALNGVKPHLMVTDPPYGVEYDPSWSDGGIKGVRANKNVGKVVNDDRFAWKDAWALFPGDVVYIWHAHIGAAQTYTDLVELGFDVRSQIIWAKNRPVLSRAGYHWQHEPCWYAVRKNATGHWSGDRKQSTLWQIDIQKAEHGHGTPKPVECMKRPIENNSSPGQAVYEPFSGSGTTIIAAEMTGRACHAIELNPAYVDVAVKRWMEFSGQQAILEGDGRSFADVAANRLPNVKEVPADA